MKYEVGSAKYGGGIMKYEVGSTKYGEEIMKYEVGGAKYGIYGYGRTMGQLFFELA